MDVDRLGELVGAYAAALADNLVWVVVAVGAALGYLGLRGRVTLPAWAPRAVLAAICVLGVVWAWQLCWLADDAFISFRYAHNWADGNGLVFNAGERVEGYTDFLWTALLAGADAIGLPIPIVALALCLASFVGVIVLTTRLVRQLVPEARVSLAAVAVAASYLMASFATSGLETMFATALVLAAVERARAGRVLVAGVLGIAATLTHPDHAIFYGVLGGVLAWRRVGWRRLALYAVPFVAIFVPYFVVRWQYYGQWLPNSYYAKSGGGFYFDQGSFYVLASTVAAGLVAIVPLAVVGVRRSRGELVAQFTAIAVPLYLIYVAKIGGDFMLGRLLVPVVPLLLILAEVGWRALDRRPGKAGTCVQRRLAAIALVAASLAGVPARVIDPEKITWYLTDERTFYRVRSLSPLALDGAIFRRIEHLDRYLGAHRPVYAAHAIGILGYTTGWRVVDLHGLIDPHVAHQDLAERGRPGHEKTASKDYIFQKGADLSALSIYDGAYDDLTSIVLDGETYSMTRYHADWLDPLRSDPTVKFVHFPESIDDYLARPPKPDAERQRDLVFFDRYYFSTNADPARRAKLRQRR